MSRGFWFVAGAATSAFVVLRGQAYYRRLTPAGLAEQLERGVERTARQTRGWVADFAETYSHARQAKHSELMGLLTNTERGRLE